MTASICRHQKRLLFTGTNPCGKWNLWSHPWAAGKPSFSGASAEACTPAVLAKRGSIFVSEGHTLSLSCVVQHCEVTWAGKWKWEKSMDSNSSIVTENQRHRLMVKTPTASEIQLLLEVQRVKAADMGAYRCSVEWGDGSTELGHWTYVNITRGKQCNTEKKGLYPSRIFSISFCPPFQRFPLRERSCTGIMFWLALPFVCQSFWGWLDVWVQRSNLSLNTGCRSFMPQWPKIDPTRLRSLRLDILFHRNAVLQLSKVSS